MNFQIIFVALISVFAGVSFADVTCGPDDTYVVNPVDCGSFYQCANGVPFLLQCAPTHGGSLVFDPNLKVCVWPTDYDCRESVITTKPPESATDPSELTTEHPITEDSTIKPTEPSVTVPAADVSCGSDDTFVANPFDCSSYYQCVNGIPYLFQCAPIHGGSLVFDPNLKTCVWPTDYDCRESVITTKSPESTTEPSELTVEPSTAEPTESTTERPITVPTTEPEASTIKPTEPSVTVPAADVSCGSDDTFVANPVDCSSYYQCAHGIPYLFQCAPIQGGSLVFDPNLKTCVWPTDYDCRESVITTKSPESTAEPSEPTVTEPPETFEPCSDFSHPTSCLASPSHCSFCFDTHFKDDTPRCDSYDNLLAAGCHSFDVNRTEYDSVVVTNPNSTTWLPLEPGRKRNISITFSLEKHPLDLYYLMDFSGSMADDKANLIKLSSGLLDTLANLTDDYRIGFGTFVDKPILPFGAAGDYSFHNDFPISSKTDGLVQKITNLPIKGGKDAPEAHGDALAQVIECTEQIGWRDSARRVVLLATDIDFHIAGDGKRANINAPYVEGCYLDSLGAYTEQLRMDYPSIEQLAKAYSKNQATTTVIFATSSGSVTFYRNVASQFKSAYVAVLNSDSSNVLELIKNEFAKIESRMEVEKSDTGDAVAFKFFSNCMSSTDERETTVCEHLPNSGDVTFTVEIDLAECPKDKDDTGMTFDLNPVGLPIFIEVELSYLCD